jgi:MATE family multidrug resistance protein
VLRDLWRTRWQVLAIALLIACGVAVSVMAFSAVAFWFAPHALARLFTPEAPVIDAAVTLIRIAAVFQLADGTQVVSAGALRGAADTTFPLVANVAVHWGIGLPLALFLAFHRGFGPPGLWYGLTAGLVGIAIALLARFLFLTRKDVTALS